MRTFACLLAAAMMHSLAAETIVDATGTGVEKISVSVECGGGAYERTLKKNLELSGAFTVRGDGAIKVTGAPGGTVRASGRGRAISQQVAAGDAKSDRMAARRFANRMIETYTSQTGFALDKICFVNRRGSDNADVCECYPDGQDIRQVTSDGRAVVGPRWKDNDSIFYTGYRNGGPAIWEVNTATGERRLKWNFRGLATGAAVSPDGRKAAVILSAHGNPELYVIDMASGNYKRLTRTPNASEGQPSWSPDGRRIVYVSDEARHPQLYIIDVASGAKRRLTSKGSQNVDPDWGRNGLITYITRRGAGHVAVIDPEVGESSTRLVSDGRNWEHPSWARDGRHLVAGRDKALFILDTEEGGDKPRQVFHSNGNWINPSWSK